MTRFPFAVRTLAVALLVGVGTSCGSGAITDATPKSALLGGSLAHAPALLSCAPAATSQSATGVIGIAGGTLRVGNTSVLVPANALLGDTEFRLTVPASPLVEIEIKAGAADHFVFERPVVVTIDYSRCAAGLPAVRSLSAWHIDVNSKALLEHMGGVDAPLLNTITFSTGHLSGYAVAD